MHFLPNELPAIPSPIIAEVKALLRLDHDEDDRAIGDFLRSSASLCENFIGQRLIVRTVSDIILPDPQWQRLRHAPVHAINQVERLAADGAPPQLVPSTDYAVDIDGSATGWVKLHRSHYQHKARYRVTYSAGMADDWNGVAASLRQGMVRLAGHLYSHRDAVDAGGPPSAVTALWQPHRRMRLA